MDVPTREEAEDELGIVIRGDVAGIQTDKEEYMAQLLRHPHFEGNTEESTFENGTIQELFGVMPAEDVCFKGWE